MPDGCFPQPAYRITGATQRTSDARACDNYLHPITDRELNPVADTFIYPFTPLANPHTHRHTHDYRRPLGITARGVR